MYLSRVKAKKPLIHHITNYVVANETANFTLSLGALPVMSHAHEEVEQMVSLASALLLNIGTLDEYQIEAMIKAGKKANSLSIPVVLDPVGVGATDYRTLTARKILEEVKVSVIRGNSAEIAVLAGFNAEVKGVEALGVQGAVEEMVKELALKYDCVVCATGKVDIISDGKRTGRVYNGHEMLALVTGTGCMATTINAVYVSVADDAFDASLNAQAAFGIIGELAFEESGYNPGTFHQKIYDVAYRLTDETVNERKKVELI